MSEASDCREPAGGDLCSDDTPVQGAAGPAPAASSMAGSSMASPEQPLTVESTTEVVVQEEGTSVTVQEEGTSVTVQEEGTSVTVQEEGTSVTVQEEGTSVTVQETGAEVRNGVAEMANQEEVAEVAQEVAEVVAQEEAVPIEDSGDQQGEVELAEDMLEPVDELPLDEELVEVLPTVMEDPENEAKEQKALLEGSVEETDDSKKQVHSAASENEPLKCQSEEIDSPNVENERSMKTTQELGQESYTKNDAAETKSEQLVEFKEAGKVEEVADVTTREDSAVSSEICAAEPQEGKEESTDHTPITPVIELTEEHVEHTQANEKLIEIAPTTSELADPAGTPEQPAPSETPTETKRQQQLPVSTEEEGQSQPTEILIPGELQQTSAPSEEDAQISKATTENEGVKERNEEDKKEKKKRKKSKEERKKKKSIGEKESPREDKSSKPAMMHVRGGFSCGWVGPVLQLLDTMKKLDEFKVNFHRKYEESVPLDEPGATTIRKILSASAAQDAPSNRALEIPEAAIRAPAGEGCPRCGGAVFEAERMKSRFRSYHKPCFNCKACHRILDSTLACDGPDKDVYCKLCYAKKYGPKGYGFGGGKAFLQSDIITVDSPQSKPEWVKLDRTTIKPTEGSGCPRCGGAVFAAELMMSKGQEWHISCFSCRDCKRPLDSTIACDGPDMEIYCKVDYAKRFGPKGFGFGHGPTLVSFMTEDEEEQSLTGGQVAAQPMGSKAAPGEGCPRCGFAVYAAETMLHNGKAYHRHCFSCGECNRSLDSTNTCSGPEGELLCRSCYGKLFGPHGVGYGQGAGVLSTA